MSLIIGISVILVAASVFIYGRSYWVPYYKKLTGTQETIASVMQKYGEQAIQRITPYFTRQGMDFPPAELRLLALKHERILEVWAGQQDQFKLIRTYKILAASGVAGPKLREGDKQVPEGRYRIVALNPNSHFHLSMKLNYPNDFDLLQAQKEARSEPGTNIFIHGKAVSVGCLAMGDTAIEELFALVHLAGKENVQVLIAPSDPRVQPVAAGSDDSPLWLNELYKELNAEFMHYKKPKYMLRR